MSITEEQVLCRACLLPSSEIHPIFDEHDAGVTILSMLQSFSFNVDETDKFPKFLCTPCLENLKNGYEFVETYKKSESFLCQNANKVVSKFIIVKGEQTASSEAAIIDAGQNVDSIVIVKEHDNDEGDINLPKIQAESMVDEDEDYLIERSVKLTQQQRLGGHFEDLNSESENDIQDDETQEEEKSNLELNEGSKKIHCCPVCSRIFATFKKFQFHILHHRSRVLCQICNEDCYDSEIFLLHYKMKHRYQCSLCFKSFPRVDTFNRHIQMHSNTLPQFKCPVENCLRLFSVKQSLRNHIKTIHCDENEFLCNLCGAAFKNYSNMRYHLKKHSGPSHLCTYCGKVYMQAIHLKYHMWRHTGVKPYKCSKCEKMFLSKRSLQAHVMRDCKSRRSGVGVSSSYMESKDDELASSQ